MLNAGTLAAFRQMLGWRALISAALLSLALAAALLHALGGAGSSAVPRAADGAGAGLSALPSTALGTVSATIAAQDPAYRFAAVTGGFQTANALQHLAVRAGSAGVFVHAHGLQLGLSLRGVVQGGALHALPPAGPTASANRVTFSWPGISEWYANGPAGLEQGFTLAHAPGGASDASLMVVLGVSGNATAQLAPGGQSVTFNRPGGATLHYDALSAIDASGRRLSSHMSVAGGELLLSVDTAGARFPVSVDPLLHEEGEAKLSASDESGEGHFGYTVALSADGNTALIAAPRDSAGAGAVWVFTRSGGGWSQQAKLVNGEAAAEGSGSQCGEEGEESDECGFGESIALSGDGSTALIGNPREKRYEPPEELPSGETIPGHWVSNVGAAWVYTRAGATWSQGAKLLAREEGGEGRFGKSVALSGDGQTALIGGTSDRGGAGSAWAFSRSGESWTPYGKKLEPSDGQGEAHFGRSVALSGNGQTAVIGGPGDAQYTGAAWIFTLPSAGKQWTQAGSKLTGAGEIGAGRFGYSVALSADGHTALIGARADRAPEDGEARNRGAAYVFAESGGSWPQQGAKLTGAEAGEEFGYSVALSGDGTTAVVGAPHFMGARGAAYLLKRSGSSWTENEEHLEAGAEKLGHGWLGSGVALSADSSTALAGAPSDEGRIGAAWVYGPAPTLGKIKPSSGPADGGTAVTITGSNFTAGSAVRFGGVPASSVTVESSNTIVAVSPPGEDAVEVSVTTPYGSTPTSTSFAAGLFTYVESKHTHDKGGGGPGVGSTPSGTSTGSSSGGPTGTVVVLGFGPTSGGGCGVALASRRLTVRAGGRAALRLKGSGVGTCSGKLRLRVTRKVKHRPVLKTIGTATFSILSGRSVVITIKLSSVGRALLRAGHGRLVASLLLVRQAPAPTLSQTLHVRLARQRARTPAAKTGTPRG